MTLAEFLTVCLAGNRKEVHVSSFLQSSSQYVWLATKMMCTYHYSYGVLTVRVTDHLTDVYDTTYGVPHRVPGMPPKGSVLVTTSGDLLAVYVAGHQTEVMQWAFRRRGACAYWRQLEKVTCQRQGAMETQMEFCFVCGRNTSPEEFSVRPSSRHAVSQKLIIMAQNITRDTFLFVCSSDDNWI